MKLAVLLAISGALWAQMGSQKPTWSQVPGREVAITIDDLPAVAQTEHGDARDLPVSEVEAINEGILVAARKYRVPLIGFVNEGVIDMSKQADSLRQVLSRWVQSGHELGNHTYSHADLNKLTAEQFEQEIANGQATADLLMTRSGHRAEYFRFPYNHTGDTRAKRQAIAAYLRDQHLQLATCTMENDDWIFNHAYGLALARHDGATAAKIREAYVRYTVAKIEYFTGLMRQIFGREVPQVMLLHANRLNADTLETLFHEFEVAGFKFVTIEHAQEDLAYTTPTEETPYGPMWEYRWAKHMGVHVDGWKEPEAPKWITDAK